MRPALIVVFAMALARVSWADEVQVIRDEKGKNSVTTPRTSEPQDGSKDRTVPNEKARIVRQFFEFEGIETELDEAALARYQSEVVYKMRAILDKRGNFVLVYKMNCELNSLMYELVGKEVSKSQERLLKTLELIVPNSEAQPIFELAKEDLRKFCDEQPAHCAELLDRLKLRLELHELQTLDAMVFLEGFYYNWVPLGRLSKYIEQFGEAS